MDEKFQQHIAFYLAGHREGSALLPMDSSYRPALFARHGDLTSLRYDLPLLLNREGTPDESVLSLSGLVDGAVEALGEIPEREAIAHHGYRIERELRRDLAANGGGDFAAHWNDAVSRLARENESIQDSAKRLWSEFHADGDLVDADPVLPMRVVRHAWSIVQSGKARTFRQKAARLLHKLHGILEAEMIGSAIGRTPERLRAGVGASFAGAFDFDRLSRILIEAKPSIQLSDERRRRIEGLIDVLEKQRFYSLETDGRKPYSFAFESCSDALKAYRDRNDEAVELLKALAVADLEANGDYRESVHDVLFEGFGTNGLEADELAKLPDYLICVNSAEFDPAETVQLVDLLAAGLPINVLFQTDDVLESSEVIERHLALASRSRQLVDTAIGLTDVFVVQSSASHLFRMRDALMRGLTYDGPALFSVFSGANNHTGNFPAYLVAAAAMESRVFPALVYDPSAGPDWSTRLVVDQNPDSEEEWPVHRFDYEDEKLQAESEKLAFTLADFMAMDDRFFEHYAIVPKDDWSDAMNPVRELLQTDVDGLPTEVPCITLVDDECRLQRAIIDHSTLREVRRCRNMWRSLQELGGIHNSHVERLLAQGYKPQSAALPSDVGVTATSKPAVTEPEITVEVSVPAAEENNGDDPYIETPRCTSCNECTQINKKMFAYDENKQAYIADPDAGTFRQLVEAAEGCQVSIIHPGKPRNLKEPGLEDLIHRAAEFN